MILHKLFESVLDTTGFLQQSTLYQTAAIVRNRYRHLQPVHAVTARRLEEGVRGSPYNLCRSPAYLIARERHENERHENDFLTWRHLVAPFSEGLSESTVQQFGHLFAGHGASFLELVPTRQFRFDPLVENRVFRHRVAFLRALLKFQKSE
jgi:hypothetical protein